MAAALALVESVLSGPLEVLATLSVRGWLAASVAGTVVYLHRVSALSRPSRDGPCPSFGSFFRIMYGLFGTRFAEVVLAHFLHTRRGEAQAEQVGGTTPVIKGPPELRVMILPILGAAFGGNYAYVVWDEEDGERRAIVVDPADPHPVLAAIEKQALAPAMLLCTHWHFDHASGNRTVARAAKGLRVVAGAAERTRAPGANVLVHDGHELKVGRLRVRCHLVAGHTAGSMVFEVFNAAAPDVPPVAFTGDAIFCGGCGALFECSAQVA